MAYVCNFHKKLLLSCLDLGIVRVGSGNSKPWRTINAAKSYEICARTLFYNSKDIIQDKTKRNNVCCLSTSNPRWFHKEDKRPPETRLMIRPEMFESTEKKEKKQFLQAVNDFKDENTIRRGHIEFIYTCMKYMEEFGVEYDLEAYKSIMDVFPKGKMIAENNLQVEFYHFPRHQTCAIDLLDKLEEHGICPDVEMKDIIVNIFGNRSHVYRKFQRIMYWTPKFKNMSPFPLPNPVPNDALELARLAINRMCVDLQSFVNEYNAEDLEDSFDKTWIVSGMSPKQRQLIKELDVTKAIYVEGPFLIWLRRKSLSYYRLRAEPKVYPVIEEDLDDVRNLDSSILNPLKTKATILKPSLHEQDDGIVLALCATGTSSRDSLLSWIRFLQQENPKLNDVPVLFTLKAPSKEVVSVNLPNRQELLEDQINVSFSEMIKHRLEDGGVKEEAQVIK